MVPDFMLREILSKGARKAKAAPSRDGVGWGAVGSLPRKAFLILKSLLEARLNSDEDTDELIKDWICIFILLIPKAKSPTTLNTWRPIAICSVLQKVFLKLVVTLMQELSDPLEVEQYGFRPGRQTLEPVDIVRALLAKGSSWGLPFSFAKGDLFRAFDNIKHGSLQRSLEHRKVPSRLQLAIFRELSGSTVTLDFQGQEYADIPFHKGGRQGGSETPDLWNSVVNLGLFNAKQRWKSERLGIRLKLSESSSCFDGLTLTESESFRAASFVEGDEYVVYGVFWADDAIIFGMDEVMCCRAWESSRKNFGLLGWTGNLGVWSFWLRGLLRRRMVVRACGQRLDRSIWFPLSSVSFFLELSLTPRAAPLLWHVSGAARPGSTSGPARSSFAAG